ncbi:4-hydroxy-tetrahydrodipicolinate synthase [Hydrogenophaga crassostreae]|uniref:4-hydroxy-tetrahydrodipicolinate synthase n=1 Tax=Hydrogenophaga crassostreae TaxID=1763535 RepID=A0A170AKS7_9BURK|nr:4-hydroxy-tetrahydrodipicolinate synthase [Hydrogenophaga crassostreae]AOW13836.1 4-hydroxy-tetrahydrodipicolinate synthase [Hydrogenophaga crassostreae]OAD44200.1 4-hydroxy-tetrahydrodipicolinate synthase [Hydrogenophaga crassostreae]
MTPITGSIVALVTPMSEGGKIDYPTLRKLIDWHIAEGTDCICVVGTTGESPTVTVDEHCEIIRVSVEQANKRVPIMAGCGANSTAEAINLAKFAKSVGADYQLQVVPYYNKPSQEGMFQHFKAIADATGHDLPMVLYNVPGRTVADLSLETVLRLAQLPGIVGIKEATGNIDRAIWLIREVPKGFAVLSGDDPTAVALMLCGGQGNVSVTANIAPRLMHELCAAAVAGDTRAAMAIQMKLMPVHKNLFVEANPIPLKWAMARMGLCQESMRLPLTPMSRSLEPLVESALKASGLLS